MLCSNKILLGARSSKLSQAQTKEVAALFPDIEFIPVWLETTGDHDQKTSLRTRGKDDFFTKEIDEGLLRGDFRIAIHSAKDLPFELRPSLKIVALTQGVDPSESLVHLQDEIPLGAKIGTSSPRRDEMLRAWRADLQCIDIRGAIEARLKLLDDGHLDGVVIAEAALIRLGLTHRKRMKLPGLAAPLQGKLAVVAHADDHEMEKLFSSIDTRKILYLGTEPKEGTVHFPVLKLTPRPIPLHILDDLPAFTHIIFTSKNAVSFFEHNLSDKIIIALGTKTAKALLKRGIKPTYVAKDESQEGVVDLLRPMNLDDAYILYPRSSIARTYLESFMRERCIRYQAVDLYDTTTNNIEPTLDLHEFKEIIFTSPSTVRSFIEIFGHLPKDKILTAIGPITQYSITLV